MAKFKPPKRLFGNKEVVHSYQGRRGKPAGPPKSPAHPEGLQHVEFAFASLAKEDPALDDASIHEAVQLSVKRTTPAEPASSRVANLCAVIGSIRETRTNVPDSEWLASLRKVAANIRGQSSLAPGVRTYIDHLDRFLP